MEERTAVVNIGGQEYEMLLTTRATKQIAGRYGGLENPVSYTHLDKNILVDAYDKCREVCGYEG